MLKKIFFLTFFQLLFLVIHQSVFAADYTVFGPATYRADKGKPTTQNVTFESKRADNEAKLVVINGDERGNYRVSSATISLNGKQIATPSDFNQKISIIEKNIAIEKINTLSIKIVSAPDSYVTIKVIGSAPPLAVSILYPVDQDVVHTPTTVVKGQLQSAAQYVEISVNGQRALVTESEFVINSLPLYQGENTITVFATNSYREQAQAEITVYSEQASGTEWIDLQIDDPRGFAPLETKITAELHLLNAIQEGSAQLSYVGPGEVLITPQNSTTFSLNFTSPGLYNLTYSVTDINGSNYTREAFITIEPPFTEDDWFNLQNAIQSLEDLYNANVGLDSIVVVRDKVLAEAKANQDFSSVVLSSGALCLIYKGKIPFILDLPDPNAPATDGSREGGKEGNSPAYNPKELEQLLKTKKCKKCNLEGANLEGADLKDAFFPGSNLKGANLKNADLRGVSLWDADLRSANLSGANLSIGHLYANLSGANLSGADLSGANLDGGNLKDANMEQAVLVRVNLREARLQGANLQRADLREATLSWAKMEGADLREIKIEGAIMEHTFVHKATLDDTVREYAKQHGAQFTKDTRTDKE